MDDKISAYIFDIDGTLAETDTSGDYSGISDLPVNQAVRNLDLIINSCGDVTGSIVQIIIVTARPEMYTHKTMEWLVENGIHFDAIYFKADDDQRSDAEYKADTYKRYIEKDYDILGSFDNDPLDIAMWRELGIPTFQV